MWWHTVTHGRGKSRGNWRMEYEASILHTTSEHDVSSITTADAHTSAASSWLNWRPPADLNGLDSFAERLNLVSVRMPSHFNRPLPQFVVRDSMPWLAASLCLKADSKNIILLKTNAFPQTVTWMPIHNECRIRPNRTWTRRLDEESSCYWPSDSGFNRAVWLVYKLLKCICIVLFVFGATTPTGPWPPYSRGF